MQPVETALEAALLVLRNGGSTVAADRSLNNIVNDVAVRAQIPYLFGKNFHLLELPVSASLKAF
jgi:hypothetical protein